MAVAAASALSSGRSAIVAELDLAPWRDTLRDAIEAAYAASGGGNGVRYVEAEDIENPGEYLIAQLDDSSGYRPNAQTPAAYIQSRGGLRDRIFWVRNAPAQRRDAWCAICKDLAGSVQFVLEFADAGRPVSGAAYIKFGDLVQDYDFAIFALAVAFSREECGGVRTCRYIAELACLRGKRDAAEILDFAMNFPPDADPCRHGLALEAVWLAQIRTAYHIVEEARRAFVDRYRRDIAACLPQSQYNEVIDDPENAEFALLWYLSRASRPKPRLTLPQDDEELLGFLRDARNALAHGKTLSPQALGRLFTM